MIDSKLLEGLKVSDYAYTESALAPTYDRYDDWTQKKWHGPLSYLADHRKELRKDIRNFYPDFKSALVFLFSYHQERSHVERYLAEQVDFNQLKIASYAFSFGGEDYHHQLKRRLTEIGESLKVLYPALEYKLTLDVHPVMERDLAHRAGLGWFGKNSMLIHPQIGSFFMIGSLLLNQKLPLAQKKQEADHCGTCMACVDVCPTEAIDPILRQIEAAKCISTFTIELFKEESQPPPLYDKVEHEIFGCDLCQDVCPWNKRLDKKFSSLSAAEFTPTPKQSEIIDFFLRRPKKQIEQDLEEMSNSDYRKRFQGTALERSGRRGLLKNLRAIKTS